LKELFALDLSQPSLTSPRFHVHCNDSSRGGAMAEL
jgi:hypothetical protein